MWVFFFFPEERVKKLWAIVSKWREWRGWRGNHLRRSRERWGQRRWKSKVLIASFKAPPKGKSIPEDTHNPTLAISRSKHPVSEEFLRKHSEVHQIFFLTPLLSSLQQNKMFLLFLKQLPDRKPGHEMKINLFPSLKKKKKKCLSKMSRF